MRRRVLLVLAVLGLALLSVPAVVPPAGAASGTGLAASGLSQSWRWITDAQGRVVILHGLNQVFKVPPYEPSADGFSDDDAAFLAANGFNAVRVGVIWAAVEPQPGVYDDAYLDSVDQTVSMLAAHGIVSLLDFHQDMYNEKFQGEGAPAWAVQDGGLPNPSLGFPGNYLGNPAEWHTWDQFWKNAPAPDGVGLQVHYARAWAHVAAHFATDTAVAGYEVMNEPWPGTFGERCAIPFVGCPYFDSHTLTSFYRRVVTAIRTVDTVHTVYIEPNVLFSQSDRTYVGAIADHRIGFAFHDYCSTENLTQRNVLCMQQDNQTVSHANSYAQAHFMPPLMTEFGATTDLTNITEMVRLADKYRMGWLEWAYTGNDKTSSSPNGQALVLDPSQPPTGSNVLTDKLKALAEPYPQIIAGNPRDWSFNPANRNLVVEYRSCRVNGTGCYGPGAITQISVPAIWYPTGYRVSVSGGTVVSTPNAPILQIASNGSQEVSLGVAPT